MYGAHCYNELVELEIYSLLDIYNIKKGIYLGISRMYIMYQDICANKLCIREKYYFLSPTPIPTPYFFSSRNEQNVYNIPKYLLNAEQTLHPGKILYYSPPSNPHPICFLEMSTIHAPATVAVPRSLFNKNRRRSSVTMGEKNKEL